MCMSVSVLGLAGKETATNGPTGLACLVVFSKIEMNDYLIYCFIND